MKGIHAQAVPWKIYLENYVSISESHIEKMMTTLFGDFRLKSQIFLDFIYHINVDSDIVNISLLS